MNAKLLAVLSLGAMALPTLAVTVTVAPDAVFIDRGIHIRGDLSDVLASDDHYFVVRNGTTVNRTEAPIAVRVEAVAPGIMVEELHFSVENHVSIRGLHQFVELFDFAQHMYIEADSRHATLEDSVDTVNGPEPRRFIEPDTRRMRSQLRIRPEGPVFTNTWATFVDLAQWELRGT